MKYFLNVFIFIGVLCLSCGVALGTTIIDQKDNVVAGYWDGGNNPKIFPDSYPGLTDTVGVGFDTSKVEINNIGDMISISIFTKFSGYSVIGDNPNTQEIEGVEVELADFFISDGSEVCAVDLSWNGSVDSKGFFSLGDEPYITSQDIFNVGEGSGLIFGAWHDINGVTVSPGDRKKINVDFDQGKATKLSDITVSSVLDSDSLSWIYSFDIDNSAGHISDTYSIFFGTAECGNDVITGTVPEPTTMVLFGFGLLGLSALGRRKSNI